MPCHMWLILSNIYDGVFSNVNAMRYAANIYDGVVSQHGRHVIYG